MEALARSFSRARLAFSRISRIGTNGLDQHLARKVMLTNIFAIVVGCSCLPFVFVGLSSPVTRVLGWTLAIAMSLEWLVIVANHHGFVFASRMWLILNTYSIIFIYSLMLGSKSTVPELFYPAIALPMILFDQRHRWLTVVLCAVCYIMREMVDVFYVHYGSVIPIDAAMAQTTRHLVHPVAFFLSIVFIAAPLHDAYLNERRLMKMKAEADAAETARAVAETRAKLRANFFAMMSHEIRTPLNGIIGLSDLIVDTPLDEEQLEMAQSVRSLGKALLGIVNDIMDYSKIEAEKLQLESIAFDPEEVVEEVLNSLCIMSQDKDVEVLSLLERDMPRPLMGDPLRLQQILANLLSNAVKFTAVGHVVLKLSINSRDEENVVLRFDVTDTGIGLTEEARKCLFQPFTQAEEGTSRKFGGTGLGLVICKHLSGLMGGDCTVESVAGVGSTFTVTIPFKIAVEDSLSESFKQSHVTLKLEPGEPLSAGLCARMCA
eukprot:TRINITY_DN3802_c0_g1_i3.p1 TRINITY_DN3802_c0_g1~~TRINITY_DN3802_c0_g1_i3.p1  ORF type:complete len:490 (-),score=140.75 TRINITY_DN3802_c0_g1_i3:436-1905(-)